MNKNKLKRILWTYLECKMQHRCMVMPVGELLSLLIMKNSRTETFLKEFSKLLDSSWTVSDS